MLFVFWFVLDSFKNSEFEFGSVHYGSLMKPTAYDKSERYSTHTDLKAQQLFQASADPSSTTGKYSSSQITKYTSHTIALQSML